jgi:gamma-glutamylcyclotransferase (GGCT)/AIG2-like uncharacterized protein YtfP
MEQTMTLYFAYGSNLNLQQMQRRCPDATPMDKLYLQKWKLVFRGVADVVPSDDHCVPGGLWKLTKRCEAALDRYEGWHPDQNGMYRKVTVAVDGLPDGETHVMMYVMNSTGICPPAVSYFDGIRAGYKDFGLKVAALTLALKHSHDEKRLSHVERKRLRRNGRPALKGDPRTKVQTGPVREWPDDAHKVRRDREASRWTEIRERAQEADRASAALKAKPSREWVDRTAKRSRMNTLSEWLEDQKASGNRF